MRVAIAALVLALATSVAFDGARAAQAAPLGELAKKKKKKKKKKKAPVLSTADGDALPAAWETKPATNKKKKKKKKKRKGKKSATAIPELWRYGASPHHKDIFVQLNFQSEALRQSISCESLDQVHNAFANAPVTNPDGKPGINIHLDAGKSCPSRSYALGDSRIYSIPGNPACPTLSEVFNYGLTQFADARLGVFRFAAIADGCGNDHGAAPQPGLTSAVFVSGSPFGKVFMHELGHNLGLDHDCCGGQPNRFSVMGARMYTSPDGAGATTTEVIDYNRTSLPALDENALNEQTGVQSAAHHNFFAQWDCPPGDDSGSFVSSWPADADVDWNCSTTGFWAPPFFPPDIQSTPVAADISGDGQMTVIPATSNEWPFLDYQGTGGAPGGIGTLLP